MRLLTDTTVVQTVVGSSFSVGLRNEVMGLGAMTMLIYSAPKAMGLMLLAVAAVVLPVMWFGRRGHTLSRDSQDRIADSSAHASKRLYAIATVQSYGAQEREAKAFQAASHTAVDTALRCSRDFLVAFVMIASSAAMLWGFYLGTQAVLVGRMSAGELSQTLIYVLILADAVAV